LAARRSPARAAPDGKVEESITTLSCIRWLFVSARISFSSRLASRVG
jgi:hypothetical protein